MPINSVSALCGHCHRPAAGSLSQQLINTDSARLHLSCAASLQIEPQQQGRISQARQLLQTQQHMSAPAEQHLLSGTFPAKANRHLELHLKTWINTAQNPQDKEARVRLMNRMMYMQPTYENKKLVLTGNLELIGTQHITALPDHLHIKGSLELVGCNQLESMPEHLKIEGHLEINGCTALKTLSQHTQVSEELSLLSCPKLVKIPQMDIGGDIDIMDCQRLAELQHHFHAKGNLSLSDNPVLTQLPPHLRVDGDCNFQDSHGLTGLPDAMQTGGDLILAGCWNITHLPEWVFTLGPITQSNNATRIIDISGTGLPEQTLAQIALVQHQGKEFILGQGHLNQKKFMAVETRPGHEALDLLDILMANPQQSVFIKYKNSPGIDQGGLSNQAFENAYHTFLQSKTGLFQKQNNEYRLQAAVSRQSQTQQIQHAYSFGLILGRISSLSMGVGQHFHDRFYQQLHIARAQLQINKLFDLNSILSFTESAVVSALASTISAMDSKTYSAQVLQNMDKGDIQQTLQLNFLPVLAIARGMADTGKVSAQDSQQLKLDICGPDNLKETILQRLEVRQHSKQNTAVTLQLKQWLETALQQATHEELQAFCHLITGASSLNKTSGKLLIQPYMADDKLLLSSFTCAHVLNININVFGRMFEAGLFDLFKCSLFDNSQGFAAA